MAGAGSFLRTACSVLALAAAAAATDAASAQAFDPAARDIRTGVYQGQLVTYEVIDGLAIWDGDIILGTPEELSPEPFPTAGNPLDGRNKISAVSSKEGLWPGGIIPYVIDPELTNPYVADAIQHWNENTVIRLVERTNQPNWVRFRPGSNCSATVGMVGGEGIVSLRETCSPGSVVHEIGHAAGLWHEHQRNDRDRHVWVSPRSLRTGGQTFKTAYEQKGALGLDSGPYDYGSVMHYRFIGRMETIPPGIVVGRGGPQLGRGSDTGLSPADIDGVSRLYGKPPTRTTVATNVAGLMIEVDGVTYTAPHRFDWQPGSVHTIGVASPQQIKSHYADYERYLFAKWSDGGAQSHTVTASSETTILIANFIEQIRPQPSAHPPEGGTVGFSPASADGFYPRLSYLKAIAEPAEGFSFERWGPGSFQPIAGGFSSNPALDRAGQRYPALFTQQPLTTIDTNHPGSRILVDGSQMVLPASFGWEDGSTHTLELPTVGCCSIDKDCCTGKAQYTSGYRLVFKGWSDGGAETHNITVSGEPATIKANFTEQVVLDTGSYGPGTVIEQPRSSAPGPFRGTLHELATTVQLNAQPAPGHKFVTWLGDMSGTENPQSLLMDSFKWVRAFFLDENTFESAKLTSGRPFNLLFGPGSSRPEGYNGYWIVAPRGATQLDIRLVTTTPMAEVDLYANREYRPRAVHGANKRGLTGYESLYSSTEPGGNETISITKASSPPLQPGPYFIAVHVRTKGVRVRRILTAEVTVPESEIAVKAPAFGIPAHVITTREGEAAPPQILEVHNSGRGRLDYEIATDQPWLSVSPDQGSATDETDIIEIRADPTAMEPGAFEGTITITERQPAGGFAALFSKSTPPAGPVTVPVTFIIIPESWEDPSGTTPTMPEDESGGLAVEARLHTPEGVAVDAAGNLYIADTHNSRIRKVEPSGIISTIAGTGMHGFAGDGGPAAQARLSLPRGVAVDADGSLYIADYQNHRIRRVDPSGIISTVAGTGERGFGGDGGPAAQARLNFPRGVAVDTAGNLYIADYENHRIRRVDPSGAITTLAGTGERGFAGDGGPAAQARLGYTEGITVDADGNLYIADTGNSRIRRVNRSGAISTLAGTGERGFRGDGGPAVEAKLDFPAGVVVDAGGNLYIADASNRRIRKVDPSGAISTVAGTGEQGFAGDGGPAVEAKLNSPYAVAVDGAGNLYIADTYNYRIRRVDPSGTITTIAGRGE